MIMAHKKHLPFRSELAYPRIQNAVNVKFGGARLARPNTDKFQ